MEEIAVKLKIAYGSTERTQILDEQGSTVTTETKFRAGVPNWPVRMRYHILHKCSSQRQEHEAYMLFSNQLVSDKTMLDPAVSIEHTKHGDEAGYYFLKTSYTKLEYDV
jgi:hypothetical protein